MISDPASIIAGFAIGFLSYAILLRFAEPVRGVRIVGRGHQLRSALAELGVESRE
jgi:hypothetical protein